MKIANVMLLLAGVLLFTAPFPGRARQASTSSQTASSSTDPIIGGWLLNIDKSTNPTAIREILMIVEQENGFVFSFRERRENGYNPHSSIVTTMKGETSRIAYSDGKEDACKSRVTRDGAKKFEMELLCPSGGWKDDYEVSSDGKELTFRRIWSNTGIIAGKMHSTGAIRPVKHIVVFDRISASEAAGLIQKMDEEDAAEKARASEKAAAQAALDAAACGLAPGQTTVSSSAIDHSGWREYICQNDGFAITIPNAPQRQSLQRVNFYKLFMTEDESIVAQLWVSPESTNCITRLAEQRNMIHRKLPPGAIRGTVETTFQGQPAFETVDTHTNGPKYLLYDLDQCLGDKDYRFHARWLTGQPKPEEIGRIFSSFRRIAGENH